MDHPHAIHTNKVIPCWVEQGHGLAEPLDKLFISVNFHPELQASRIVLLGLLKNTYLGKMLMLTKLLFEKYSTGFSSAHKSLG